MTGLAGNFLSELEIAPNGPAAPASGSTVFPLVESKCRDAIVILNFDTDTIGNSVVEVALGDDPGGSDLQPIDITGILDKSGAQAAIGIEGTKQIVFLLKDLCRKYFRITAAGTTGNIRMTTIQANCRNYPRSNDSACPDGPVDQKAFTVACTCP